MNLEELKTPFSPTLISWRIGATNADKSKGIALGYLNARDVMERLDEVCGPENWQAEYPFIGCCRIGLNVGSSMVMDGSGTVTHAFPPQWIWKANGAGQSDIEAEKGQYSDAFKRAAVLWGIGRYLYDLPNTWYPIEKHGNSYRFTKEAESQMTQFLHDWQYKRIWNAALDRKKTLEAIDGSWANKDSEGLKAIWNGLTNEQKQDIWALLKEFSAKRSDIKRMLEVK